VLLIAFIVLGSTLSPFFLSGSNFSDLTGNLMEKAIMALPLALIIIAGEIDLSIESVLGLSSAARLYLRSRLAVVARHSLGPGRRCDGRTSQRTPRHARRVAVAGRHPRNVGPLPRPGIGGSGSALRRRLARVVHQLRIRRCSRNSHPMASGGLRGPGVRFPV